MTAPRHRDRPGDDTEALHKPRQADVESTAQQTTFADLQTARDPVGGDDEVIDTPNKALPQWAVDFLLFGVSKYAPASKIWGRMLSIAMSAQARGWTQMEFINEVAKTERRKNAIGQKRLLQHKLWLQLVACSRDEADAFKELDRAWKQGIEHRMDQGFRTAEDLIADAVESAWAWEDRLTERKDGLLDAEILVMSYVIAFIEKRQMTRVTCPVREVGAFTGLPKSTVHRMLKSLTEKGFLVQVSRGIWSKKPGNRKAAIYSLGDPLNLRYGGRGAPSEKPYEYRDSYIEEQLHSPWKRLLHRGACVWGQGQAPSPFT